MGNIHLSAFCMAASVLLSFPLKSLASSHASASNQCQVLSASGNAEYPPYLWRAPDNPKQLVGAIAFMIDDIAEEIGIPIELIYSGPWGRVQKEVAAGRVDMIAGAFFTEARTDYMNYIYPEFQGTETAVWYNLNNPFNYSLWSDLKPLRGVTVINNSFGQDFDQYAAQELNIRQVSSLEQGLKMLSAGRVDYLIYEKEPAMAYVHQLSISGIQSHTKAVTQQNLYLTVSQASKCNTPELKKKLETVVTLFDTQSRMQGYLEKAHRLWTEQQQ
ncbi:substrate-binding periplasmic protein [Oceanospirillum beijerinckii]|uniref:substrate-binding periplasmic protein n=1 Tax=Oceanospirillum beijerinckii TaxID=64976 RepID=UPI00041E8234|nr:transporter substrate-binding domain-containing protein [Oceanospirillum beijerinckii]MAC47307.1 ABC transporter substrate-binding protein [Oceanospirillum sp.]